MIDDGLVRLLRREQAERDKRGGSGSSSSVSSGQQEAGKLDVEKVKEKPLFSQKLAERMKNRRSAKDFFDDSSSSEDWGGDVAKPSLKQVLGGGAGGTPWSTSPCDLLALSTERRFGLEPPPLFAATAQALPLAVLLSAVT